MDDTPVTTYLTLLIALVVVLVGGVVCIIEPETLSFRDYVEALAVLGIGVGALGIGRGISAGAKASQHPAAPVAVRRPPE